MVFYKLLNITKMKKHIIKTQCFEELSEESKEKAIENLYDINVDQEWWLSVYEDAENIGCKISAFDIDRGSFCDISFTDSAISVAESILKEHGEMCETYKAATNFIAKWQPVYNDYLDENSEKYESSESEDEIIELEDEFLKNLSEDYRIMLSKEFDYLTTKEAIIETIKANNYEFLETGELY